MRRRREAGSQPYLSVVVATRNDDHGVDLLRRTQIFLDGLAAQARRHRVDTELIVVEWNPPADRPPLAEALVWPPSDGFFSARVVTVPERVHRGLDHSDRLLLFQMIAKNVGIRRAHGEFILATNVDLLFSDELMSFLAQRVLRHDRLYRVDRYDAASDVPYPAPVAEQLAWCDRHLVRICRREGTYDLVGNRVYRIYEDIRLPLWTAPWLRILRNGLELARFVWVVFYGAFRELGRRMPRPLTWLSGTTRMLALAIRRHGFPRKVVGPKELLKRSVALVARARTALAAQRREAMRNIEVRGERRSLRQLLADVRQEFSWTWRDLLVLFADEKAMMRMHTNACGDFTLVAREAWHKTRAYPELQLFSMHLDSLFMYQAHYHGITEEFLPFRVYHIEHSHGFKPDDESVNDLNSRLEEVAIPQISNAEFHRWVIEMHKAAKPRFENDDTWGFSELELPEQTVVERAAAAPRRLYA
jgi:hypothetical protein